MRIRFFNTFEPVPSYYRDLLPFLAEEGFEIEVVVSSKEYRAGRAPLRQSLNHPRIRIRHIPAGRGVATSRLQKLWAMVTYLIGASGVTLFGRSADINFFLTQPPLFSLWGYVLRLLRRQSYMCLVMDIYPDVAVRDGLLSDNGPLTRVLTYLSRFALRKADSVVVIGRDMRDLLAQQGVAPERMAVIPNWVNDKEVFPVPQDKNALRQQLEIESEFVVLYSGNLGVSHFFDDILEVARRLQDKPGILFLFVGEGSRKQEVMLAKKQDQLDNVRLLPFQPTARLAESLSMGDIHFICLREGFAGLVVPSKAYGALGSGRPLLYQGNANGEIALMIVEEKIGQVVPLNNPEALAAAILHYYAQSETRRVEGARALSLNQGKYSYKSALQKYLQLFQNFVRN